MFMLEGYELDCIRGMVVIQHTQVTIHLLLQKSWDSSIPTQLGHEPLSIGTIDVFVVDDVSNASSSNTFLTPQNFTESGWKK